MRKYTIIALMVGLAFVTLAAMPGYAQAVIKADVPFDFTVAHGVLPAGEYSIALSTVGDFLVLSSGQRYIDLIIPMTSASRPDFTATKLVFHRYGDQYFLAEIWSGLDTSIRKLKVHPRERQLMAKQGRAAVIAVVRRPELGKRKVIKRITNHDGAGISTPSLDRLENIGRVKRPFSVVERSKVFNHPGVVLASSHFNRNTTAIMCRNRIPGPGTFTFQ